MVGSLSFEAEAVPPFCHSCSKPYPWMEDRLETAKELLYDDDKLTQNDRDGALEAAQDMPNHSDPRTTNPYDRRKDLAPRD